MRPMKLTDKTRTMSPPADWDEQTHGPCERLDIHDAHDEAGNPVMISAWQLEAGDLEKLAAGAPLYLRIYGTAHPVIALYPGEPTQVPN